MSEPDPFLSLPLAAVGKSALLAADTVDVTAELAQFEAAIRDYSLNRTGVDWPLTERLAQAIAAQRCDLKIYSYLTIAAFRTAAEDSEASPYLALGAALRALGDLIESGWERCLPRLLSRRQAQLKWLSEELAVPVRGRPPRPVELPLFLACLAEAERVAELGVKIEGLGYPLLRELREVLATHKPPPLPAPPPAAKPPPPLPAKLEPIPNAAAPAAVSPAPPAPRPPTTPDPVPLPVPAAKEDPAGLSREALEDSVAERGTLLAAQLRAESLTDPTSYWLLRTLRWASHDLLRPERAQEVISNKYQTVLPLPADYKSLLKQLPARLVDGQHAEVLADCEELFASYPLWLDLQRFVATALDALGAGAARQVLTSQLLLLLHRCPQLPQFRFADREATPLADSQTTDWLRNEQQRAGSGGTVAGAVPEEAAESATPLPLPLPLALEPAVRMLHKSIGQASSGQQRFALKLQLGELLLENQRSDIAMPIVDALLLAVETHQLSDWQPELCEQALRLAVRTGRAAELETSRRAELWARLCRVSPSAALELGPEVH